MTIGDRIKLKREELRLSQIELSKKTGIKSQLICKYENKVITNIPTNNIQKIASALMVSPAYLMGWESEQMKDDFSAIEYLYLSLDEEKRKFLLSFGKFLKEYEKE